MFAKIPRTRAAADSMYTTSHRAKSDSAYWCIPRLSVGSLNLLRWSFFSVFWGEISPSRTFFWPRRHTSSTSSSVLICYGTGITAKEYSLASDRGVVKHSQLRYICVSGGKRERQRGVVWSQDRLCEIDSSEWEQTIAELKRQSTNAEKCAPGVNRRVAARTRFL